MDCVAIHETGHALAHILTGYHFDYVTIEEDKEISKSGQRVLGLTKLDKPQTNEAWDQFSILNPNEFDRFFKVNFISLSGYVSEEIYRGRYNTKSSKEDFRQWFNISLKHLSVKVPNKIHTFEFNTFYFIYCEFGDAKEFNFMRLTINNHHFDPLKVKNKLNIPKNLQQKPGTLFTNIEKKEFSSMTISQYSVMQGILTDMLDYWQIIM